MTPDPNPLFQLPTVEDFPTLPERTIGLETTIAEAEQILSNSGKTELQVVDPLGKLAGVILHRDLEVAAKHGFSHVPVKEHLSPLAPTPVGTLHERPVIPISMPSLLAVLRDRLVVDLWHLLTIAAQQAEARGWQLFLVGGAVRDVWLAQINSTDEANEPFLLEDIDLVVDGVGQAAEAAGIELARSLQAQYPEARLEIHPKFQTAALQWKDDPIFKSLGVDIATARTEVYSYPAANPIVAASSIQQDLYRRDFTINALAVRLTPSDEDPLLDFFGGAIDLQAKQIRVLHANSFIEDPTRIYRAVRFAVRFGFTLEPQTEQLIRSAIACGIFQKIRDRAHPNFQASTPALQTRLKAELQNILQTPYWLTALHLLADLDALTCIHPSLKADAGLWRQLRVGARGWGLGVGNLDLGVRSSGLTSRPSPIPYFPSPWLLRLEILLAHLPFEHRGQVAAGLQLPIESIDRLNDLAMAESELFEALSKCELPSQVVQVLNPYAPALLILVAVRSVGEGFQSKRAVRKMIWRYLTQWSLVKSPLDGKDLKALGYQPDRQFKQILKSLTNATLDGKIRDRAQAQAFLQQTFPLFLKPTE